MITAIVLAVELAQQNASQPGSAEDAVVRRLVESSQHLDTAMPSLSCEETIVSQQLRDGVVRREVHHTMQLRVQRTSDPQRPFAEEHSSVVRDGKAVPDGKSIDAPYVVTGAFAHALGFTSMEKLDCLSRRLTDEPGSPVMTLYLERLATGSQAEICRNIAVGSSKMVVIDRASGQVQHLVRTIPAATAAHLREVSVAIMDYAPVHLGSDTFWLPQRAELSDGTGLHRAVISYSGCHRFGSTVTITGGTETVPGPQ